MKAMDLLVRTLSDPGDVNITEHSSYTRLLVFGL
jgi:DNA-binding transcriptional MocR family regulator